MNVGGAVVAWVPKSTLGCLPLRTGCGCSAIRRPRKVLSAPVPIRVSQPSSALSSAGTSRSMCQPVRAVTLIRGAHCTCTSSRSISRSR